ncbi:MAG TPA: GGDEF domain-containing protein [Solirubrobacteraceae bacterium]|nr:GGDEF domain-containing protein [Solirubrobacteraceae bacterium]
MAISMDHRGRDDRVIPSDPHRRRSIAHQRTLERILLRLRSLGMPPPGGDQVRRRAPFIAVVVVAWGLALTRGPLDGGMYVAATSTGFAALAIGLLIARRDGALARAVGDLPSSLLLLAAIALLRASVPGGPLAPYGAVALVPVFWTALYGDGLGQLTVMLVALAGFFAAPPLIVGAPAYSGSDLVQAIVPLAVAAIVCVTAQQLVARARREAADAREQRGMIEQVGAVVPGLFASADVRSDLCAATLRVAGASAAILLEPAPGGGTVRVTAEAGVQRTMLGTTLPAASALGTLLADGRRRLLSHVDPARLSQHDLWEAGGRPATVLYQPLLRRGDEPVGMLIVGWSEVLTEAAAHVSAVGLLTHEAALLLSRADQLAHLAGIATTDALTGLPNRRAWDARVKRAIRDDERLAVAMIDLDNFKRFNDTHGHPEGDALLRETAAAWLEYVREGDLLARLGGEEFGLLLPACGEDAAVEVVERLRAAVTHGQTCSAGLAVRRGAESVESAIERADVALYAAKRAGRDLARTAV